VLVTQSLFTENNVAPGGPLVSFLVSFGIPRNAANTTFKRGIENLFPECAFLPVDYNSKKSTGNYGEKVESQTFLKAKCAERICTLQLDAGQGKELFSEFDGVVSEIESWVESWAK